MALLRGYTANLVNYRTPVDDAFPCGISCLSGRWPQCQCNIKGDLCGRTALSLCVRNKEIPLVSLVVTDADEWVEGAINFNCFVVFSLSLFQSRRLDWAIRLCNIWSKKSGFNGGKSVAEFQFVFPLLQLYVKAYLFIFCIAVHLFLVSFILFIFCYWTFAADLIAQLYQSFQLV